MKLLVLNINNKDYDALSVIDCIKAESNGRSFRIKNVAGKADWLSLLKKIGISIDELVNYTILVDRKMGCTHYFASSVLINLLNK